jgi:putative ABC transport system permease protein
MNLVMIPRLALKALMQNKLRSGLTMLGIIIGVAAVICVVAIGEGASTSVERAITNLGANLIWVEAGGVNRAGVRTGIGGTRTLLLTDYEAIKEQITLVTNVTPQGTLACRSFLEIRTGTRQSEVSVRSTSLSRTGAWCAAGCSPRSTSRERPTSACSGRRSSISCSANRSQSERRFA